MEKTRLVHQIEGERNFHIFYQLLRSKNHKTLLEELHLANTTVDDYAYTSCSSLSSNIPNIDDSAEFQHMLSCLESIVDEPLKKKIFQLLAGILHLGNVEFFGKDEAQQISTNSSDDVGGISTDTYQSFLYAAELFGVEAEDLLTCLTKQNMYVNNAVIVKVQTLAQAGDKKHSFAKSIYSMLFSWLVDKINSTINVVDKTPWGKETLIYLQPIILSHHNDFHFQVLLVC